MSNKLAIILALSVVFISQPILAMDTPNLQFRKDYAKLVYLNYSDAYNDAKFLQKEINKFLEKPSVETLESAKAAWLKSRKSYGQTEAFRFYEGPIDFIDDAKGIEGPEARLNAWPLDEAYIDYTKGNPNSGIINNKEFVLTKENLINNNQQNDESEVALGYHAIEFLLWGQDFSLQSAGTRSFTDYAPNSDQNIRRRQYLKLATEILVEDLKFLVKEWDLQSWKLKENYADKFTSSQSKIKAEQDVLTALATLSVFELSSERMGTALDSSDQEDEHSCFSDNTYNDFIYNQQGIKNVYLGDYGNFDGVGIHDLIARSDKDLANKILKQINETSQIISEIPYPIDAKVLATKKGSKARAKMELAVASLQKQAKLFLEAGKELNINVQIMSE